MYHSCHIADLCYRPTNFVCFLHFEDSAVKTCVTLFVLTTPRYRHQGIHQRIFRNSQVKCSQFMIIDWCVFFIRFHWPHWPHWQINSHNYYASIIGGCIEQTLSQINSLIMIMGMGTWSWMVMGHNYRICQFLRNTIILGS